MLKLKFNDNLKWREKDTEREVKKKNEKIDLIK